MTSWNSGGSQRFGRLVLLAVVAAGLLLGGCWNSDRRIFLLDVAGEVDVVDPSVDVVIEMYFATAGEGELEHPLVFLDSTAVAGGGSFSYQLEYPADEGEGLVVYAFEDSDGDGLLCGQAGAWERSGLVEVPSPLGALIDLRLSLVDWCQPPEALYP